MDFTGRAGHDIQIGSTQQEHGSSAGAWKQADEESDGEGEWCQLGLQILCLQLPVDLTSVAQGMLCRSRRVIWGHVQTQLINMPEHQRQPRWLMDQWAAP